MNRCASPRGSTGRSSPTGASRAASERGESGLRRRRAVPDASPAALPPPSRRPPAALPPQARGVLRRHTGVRTSGAAGRLPPPLSRGAPRSRGRPVGAADRLLPRLGRRAARPRPRERRLVARRPPVRGRAACPPSRDRRLFTRRRVRRYEMACGALPFPSASLDQLIAAAAAGRCRAAARHRRARGGASTE